MKQMVQDLPGAPIKPISAFVKRIIRLEMNAPDVDQDFRLQKAWTTVAGDSALHALPSLQRSGKLVIVCNSPVWATLFRSQAPTILKQFKQQGVSVKEVVVRVSPSSSSKTPAASSQRAEHVIPISEKAARHISETARNTTNPRLKASLEKLAQTARQNLRVSKQERHR